MKKKGEEGRGGGSYLLFVAGVDVVIRGGGVPKIHSSGESHARLR